MEHRRATDHRRRRDAARSAALAPRHAARAGRARGASLPDGRPHGDLRVRVRAALPRRAGSPSAGSTSAAPARRAGSRVDEYTAEEHADICDVIAWLAAQEWSNGRVGMYGASWSGFNSLQVACLRPPALHAIAPIYASDDRYTDDVHYMGGILKAVDLVDWVLYMVAGNALPPVPAVVGDALARGVGASARGGRAVAPALARGAGGRPLLAARLRPARLRADRLPDDDRGGLGRRLHEHRLPRARVAPLPDARAARPLGSRLAGDRDPRAARRPRPGADPLVPPLARRRAERRRRGAVARRLRAAVDEARPGAAGDARRVAERGTVAAGAALGTGAPAGRCTEPTRSRSAATSGRRPGSRARAGCRGACPATSGGTTRSRSATTGSRSPRSSTSWDTRGCASP